MKKFLNNLFYKQTNKKIDEINCKLDALYNSKKCNYECLKYSQMKLHKK